MKINDISLYLINTLADGEFHSGERLGRELNISRAAINKHINLIRTWGLEIASISGRGYKLANKVQLLDSNYIYRHLAIKEDVTIVPVVSSTNQYLLDRIAQLKSGEVCLAEFQYAGRGRRGRRWFSPFATNLYLSMFWHLEQGPMATMGLSLIAGIATAEVLRMYGAANVRLKWPNDIYLNQRKLAGILVEMSGRTGDVAKIVIGVGINIAMHSIDETIVDQAWVNLQAPGTEINRSKLAADLINRLRTMLAYFERDGLSNYITRWNKLDCFYNSPVKLLIGEQSVSGIARGIDKQGNLLLEKNGELTAWFSGEISLRAEENE